METQEEKVYALFVVKKPGYGGPIVVKESTNFDELFSEWQELTQKWKSCATELKPFELTKPIVTAFEPGQISEITVRPKVKSTRGTNPNNPYEQAMREKGFSGAFPGNEGLLDEGYS